MGDLVQLLSRAEMTGTGNTLTGYAAVYDTVTEHTNEGYAETIARGAFDAVLADDATDVRALFNHNMSLVLGRQSAGTLRLRSDAHGLHYEIDLPHTTYADDLKEMVRRGDVTGASLGFMAGEIRRGTSPGGRPMVTHVKISRLVEISAVPLPIYPEATVALRAHDPHAAALARRDQLIRLRARVRGVTQ